MVNNIGSSSGAQSSYYSQANDTTTNRSDTGSRRSARSAGGQFGSLAARQNTFSEFGSVASAGPLDYSDYAGNPYYDQNAYSQWAGSARTPSEASSTSAASFASADNRSFDQRSNASAHASSHSASSSQSSRRSRSDVSAALSEAGSRQSAHVQLSGRSGNSNSSGSSIHQPSDVGRALSEAGSRHSSEGRPPTQRSDNSWTSHQNRLPSISDGGYQRSLTGSELGAIRTARQGGRFFSGSSDLGSVASSLNESDRAAIARATEGGRFGRRGWAPGSSGSSSSSVHTISTDSSVHTISSDSSVHSIAENLSEAGSRSSSAERAELVERLNRLRNIEGSIPADSPSVMWQPDTELSVSDITLSTAVTEGGPPSRRPPPPPSRLRHVSFADNSTASAAPSYQPPVAPTRGGSSIYGRQPALSRMFNSLNPRRWN